MDWETFVFDITQIVYSKVHVAFHVAFMSTNTVINCTFMYSGTPCKKAKNVEIDTKSKKSFKMNDFGLWWR